MSVKNWSEGVGSTDFQTGWCGFKDFLPMLKGVGAILIGCIFSVQVGVDRFDIGSHLGSQGEGTLYDIVELDH
jgi:hypothetical protein